LGKVVHDEKQFCGYFGQVLIVFSCGHGLFHLSYGGFDLILDFLFSLLGLLQSLDQTLVVDQRSFSFLKHPQDFVI